ncbi:cyclic nucleotide-binding domain-containing protein [Pseudomonas sp. L-22-4S-12]|jgi:CRP/FNR family transcriptional regulator, dissimilatory nitrate respiration regulator|uniref:Crp/Fnr family transcriptional regulator n=1 Tax=unclassified Pseudomonas TaxID=196821 RepID=UPI0012F434F9|nr:MULTISPECIES: Crp/Fnr family transcriptional regulator [unclassified Pseudomonas]MWV16978.1 cyclic nucleotide-binding domain-containing protein [Pseudomonas sp. L-22-4S-12]VXB77817.1 Crp/Fnr family transcriptional regulator [Pseudomonas sp. 8AS]
MLTDSENLKALRQHHLFNRLPEALFTEVSCLAIQRKLDSGDALFHQGDAADRFYLLLNGQMKLTRVLFEGQEKLVEVIQPGQSFAEALLFTGASHYPVTCSALKASNLISIDGTHYRRLLEEQPKICLDLLASFSMRLHQRLDEIDTLTVGNASRRVVRFLCQEQREAGNGQIQLSVPKRLIASQLGIQPETFSRILHRLIDAGLIAMERRSIRVLDRPSLANYYE